MSSPLQQLYLRRAPRPAVMVLFAGLVLAGILGAAALLVVDQSRNEAVERVCGDLHSRPPTQGRVKLSGCQPQFVYTVITPHTPTLWETVSSLEATPVVYVPLWTPGEPPPIEHSVVLQVTEPFVLNFLKALQRTESVEAMRARATGSQANMVLASFANFEAGVREMSSSDREKLQYALELKLANTVYVLDRSAGPQRPSFWPLVLGLAVVGLLWLVLLPKAAQAAKAGADDPVG